MNKRQRLAALRQEAQGISTRIEDGSATDADYTRATELAGEIRTLVTEIEAEEADQGGDQEDRAAQARAALADLPPDPDEPDRRDRPGDRDTRDRGRAPIRTEDRARPALEVVGQRFSQSQGYQDFVARGMSGTAIMDWDATSEVRGSDLAMRATIGSAQIPTRNPYLPGMLEMPARPLSLLDMVDRQTTGLNSVPYVQETPLDPTTGATEVAEGAAKPEVDVQFAEEDAPVRTIAAWVNITRQAAEDAPTVAGFIQGRLGFKVEHRLNSQILNGNGTAPNLRGILNTVGIKTHAPVAAEARVISIRKAVTLVQQGEYQPDTVGLSPADWELVELSQDSQGMFRVSPNVQNALGPRIWGLNVVVNSNFANGTGVVGAFRLGATLWERHGVRVLMTDSHASNFTSNILTILAEMRAALTVWRPAVFCEITFNGTI
jgi:HK97 family phage major capsid protein